MSKYKYHLRLGAVTLGLYLSVAVGGLISASAQPAAGEIRIIELQGTAELMPVGAASWVLTQTNQTLNSGDKLRTGENSRLLLHWSDNSVVPFGALTEVEILSPKDAASLHGLNLVHGVVSFFHRDEPGRIQVLTHGATASVEGTEFILRTDDENAGGKISLAVLDGKVKFANTNGSVELTGGEMADAVPGGSPQRTPGFVANNLLQWCFYYPAVLDVDEIGLSDNERSALKDSIADYQAGDLLAALKHYPAGLATASEAENIFHAALLLSVGQVDDAGKELGTLSANGGTNAPAQSLRTLIAAVKRDPGATRNGPRSASELLAASYFEQSRANGDVSLLAALDFARRATVAAPQFGFAWERVAELEFGFGHVSQAETALDQALKLSPRNAQALALKGFLLASQNNISGAKTWFDRAIAADGALGNAWLGRGLCRIRRGDLAGGRSDLLTAAALEPQRAVLRSYLGKAYASANQDKLADKEIANAIRLDPADPTGWLYAALLKQQQNRVNDAIDDLRQSQALNDNRAVFRSKLLLDQDKAVGSANLANVYHDAGMDDVALREAARAVADDYDNSSAHLFISDSFDNLRDPTRFNLRYDTVWLNEFLLANMLAPVGGGRLSQTVSQQEYSKLFEQDGIGLASSSDWRSDGQFHQLASQYGTIDNTSWALDLDYQHNLGDRPNNRLEDVEWYTTIKQQLTPSDSLLFLSEYEDYSSGDNFQYYNPNQSYRPYYHYNEQEQPILLGGFQHEWAPGIRTLLLGGRLTEHQQFTDQQAPQLLLDENGGGNVVGSDNQPFNVNFLDRMEIWTAELQQIIQQDKYTVVGGARWQGGNIEYQDSLTDPPLPPFILPSSSASFSEPFDRAGAYGYLTLKPFEQLSLTAGAAYDWESYPANFRTLPQSGGTDDRVLVQPKAAVVWNPFPFATLRGIYARSLGGVSLDESYRLEPTQLAGFAQTYRSVIPESLVGSVSGQEVEVAGGALDLNFNRHTFIGLQVQRLTADVRQTVGDYLLVNGLPPYVPSSTKQDLSYDEQTLGVSINQILPQGFVSGLNYQLMRSQLLTSYPQAGAALPNSTQTATLHQFGFYLLYNHPTGLFARFDARGYVQANSSAAMPGDSFGQFDIQGGWRFWQRRGQISVGILNLGDQDYHLNPLNVYTELPRGRVFTAQLDFQF